MRNENLGYGVLENGAFTGGDIRYYHCLKKNLLKRAAGRSKCSKSNALHYFKSIGENHSDIIICKDGMYKGITKFGGRLIKDG